MSVALLDQTLANSGSVILGGGGAAPYATAGYGVPYTDIACVVTTNFTNNTGSSLSFFVSPDYQAYLAGQIAAPTWSPVGVTNNTAQTLIGGSTAVTVDSAVTTFTIAVSGAQAYRVTQTGSFSGTGTPTVTMRSVTSLAPVIGSPPSPVGTAFQDTIILPFQLTDFANSAAYARGIPFNFTVLSALFRTAKPASTTSKLATLTLSTTAGAVTGGVMALTTANQNTAGGTVAATAISGTNATSTAGTAVIITASSVTAFGEGDGWVEVTVRNNDLSVI
jgi:hypothetical protein